MSKKKKPMLDITNKTFDELEALGCRMFDDRKPRLMLIPLALYEQIPDGTALTCFTGQVCVKGRDSIDDDTRAGLMAYGVYPVDKLTQIVKKIHN
jgi:hypothetical protein